jgi:hypothetical protein
MLGRDNPVLVMATVSEMAMEPTAERMEAIAREVQATVAQCAGLVREIRGAVPGITREVGDRFLDHHTHYTTATTRRTALINTMIVLAFGALCALGAWVLRYRLEPPAPVATVNCVAVPQQRGEQGSHSTWCRVPIGTWTYTPRAPRGRCRRHRSGAPTRRGEP